MYVQEDGRTKYYYKHIKETRRNIAFHRVIAESILGKPLLKAEIHHVDGDGLNNQNESPREQSQGLFVFKGGQLIHFLRNKNNQTIVDIEVMENDVSCVVDIETYSYHLFELDESFRIEFIQDIADIQNIRDVYFETNHNFTPDELSKHRCTALSKKWGLYYVVD
jgi:hypothetical protein